MEKRVWSSGRSGSCCKAPILEGAGLINEDMRRFFDYHRQGAFSLNPWIMTHLEQLGGFTYETPIPTSELTSDEEDGWIEPTDPNSRLTSDDEDGPSVGHLTVSLDDRPAETLETEVVAEPEAEPAAPVTDLPPTAPVEETAPTAPPVIAEQVVPAAGLPVTTAPDYQFIVD